MRAGRKLGVVAPILFSLLLIGISASAAETVVSVEPQTKMVRPNETFYLNITVDPDVPIAGVQCDIRFNSSVVIVNSVEEGDLLKKGGDTYFSSGEIDNKNGTVKGIASAITTQGASVMEKGTFVIINLTAKSAGMTGINLSNVIVGNTTGEPVGIYVINGSVTVSPKIHDIAISEEYCPPTGIKIIREGEEIPHDQNLTIGREYQIKFKIENRGGFNETASVTIEVRNETEYVVFSKSFNKTINVGEYVYSYRTWDTSGLSPGAYTIRVEARIPNDANPDDNVRTRKVFLEAPVDREGPVIEFVYPTPPDGENLTVNYVNVTVKVTDKSGVGTVLLNWNGENETMNAIAPEIYAVNKTGLTAGTYTFKVYANDTLNNWNVSETRSVSVLRKKIGDMNGDGEVTFEDVIALAKHIYFGDPVHDDPDVNGDDAVTFDDVILLAKHIYFGDPIYP